MFPVHYIVYKLQFVEQINAISWTAHYTVKKKKIHYITLFNLLLFLQFVCMIKYVCRVYDLIFIGISSSSGDSFILTYLYIYVDTWCMRDAMSPAERIRFEACVRHVYPFIYTLTAGVFPSSSDWIAIIKTTKGLKKQE